MTSGTSSMNDSSSTAREGNNRNKISYRKARIEDLPGIADLLERSFDDDDDEEDDEVEEAPSPPPASSNNAWPSWNPFQNNKNQDSSPPPLDETQKLIQMLEQRLTLPQHVLIVASTTCTASSNDDEDEKKNTIVGFMELGTMPAPIPIEVPINVPAGQALEEEPEVIMVRPERPFLANLAVDPNLRRQQVGSKLVQLALKIATQWESVKAQEKALLFYFHPSSSSSSKEEEKLSTLYLSVDCDNDGAIAFYKRLQFTTVLDESSNNNKDDDDDDDDSISKSGISESKSSATRSRSTKGGQRKPKLYLEKELVLPIDDADKQ